ncbi:2Fe-2S iron-sulfur cluster-binding protein [Haladaptatus sp. DJG-WS-42]|uniref:2Fe-2S iron-sulfur cluster-binding protein n=1 Tax=Haladaptatus sp. DJG-WS-42 TaxID=3120516 RepID=UPI0030D2E199
MVEVLGVALGALLTLIAVALHYSTGTAKSLPEDITDQVLERRAASVAETDFPEPMNRSIGGGGAVGAVAGGEAGGELEEGGDAAGSSSPADIPEDEIEYFEIEYAKEGKTIEVANNETILDAGEDEGWDLPYACRQGQCISCAGKVASGENAEDYVVHDNQQMLGEEELGKGYMLTCVAYPKKPFTLETGETP